MSVKNLIDEENYYEEDHFFNEEDSQQKDICDCGEFECIVISEVSEDKDGYLKFNIEGINGTFISEKGKGNCVTGKLVDEVASALEIGNVNGSNKNNLRNILSDKLDSTYVKKEMLDIGNLDLKSQESAVNLYKIMDRDLVGDRKNTITFYAESFKDCETLKSAIAWTTNASQAQDGSVTLPLKAKIKTMDEMKASVKEAHAAKASEKDSGAEEMNDERDIPF